LVLPLDASLFESCPCSIAPLASHVTMNFLRSYACCPPMLVFACGLDESCWKGIQWCVMVHAYLTSTRLPPSKHV
jgi:hypothetical protein